MECYYQYHRYCPGGLVAVFFDQGHRRDQDHDFGAWSYYLFLGAVFSQFLRPHDYFLADQSSDYLWGYRPGCDFLP